MKRGKWQCRGERERWLKRNVAVKGEKGTEGKEENKRVEKSEGKR